MKARHLNPRYLKVHLVLVIFMMIILFWTLISALLS